MATSEFPCPQCEANGRHPAHVQARILAEALPNMLRYDEETVVIKFGGHAMGDEALAKAFAQDVVYLKQSGVNPDRRPRRRAADRRHAEEAGDQVGVRPRPARHRQADRGSRRDGAGRPHQQRDRLGDQRQGGKAVGICGKDANLMIARKITEMPDPESNLMKAVDIGYVGDPLEVNPHIVDVISKSDLIPVIAPDRHQPRGRHAEHQRRYLCLGACRAHAGQAPAAADRRRGRARQVRRARSALSTSRQARELIRDGTITGGMIPKIEGCIEVVEAGVEAVVIINGKVPHWCCWSC